jgi:hypothetical protein
MVRRFAKDPIRAVQKLLEMLNERQERFLVRPLTDSPMLLNWISPLSGLAAIAWGDGPFIGLSTELGWEIFENLIDLVLSRRLRLTLLNDADPATRRRLRQHDQRRAIQCFDGKTVAIRYRQSLACRTIRASDDNVFSRQIVKYYRTELLDLEALRFNNPDDARATADLLASLYDFFRRRRWRPLN